MKQRYALSAGFTALMAAAPSNAVAQDAQVAVSAIHARMAAAQEMFASVPLLPAEQLDGSPPESVTAHEEPADAKPVDPIKLAAANIPTENSRQKTALVSVVVKPAPAPAALAAVPVKAEPAPAPACGQDGCRVKMTAAQLLTVAEKLVANREYDKAAPLVKALGQASEYKLQHLFLTGFIQVETGKLKEAESTFRTLLHANPGQTRIRLELARVLTLRGKEGAANYHYRLAEKDDSLPEDIREAVTGIRSILRSKRNWKLSFDVGFAPDTNINSATSAETVNVNFGPIVLPLTLSDDARKTSGIGQTASLNAGLRLRTSNKTAILLDLNSRIVNYKGNVADNFQVALAAGPEIRLSNTSALSLQALGEQRWYGGQRANTDFGARIGLKKILGEGQQLNFSFDGRRTNSGYADGYSGWVMGGSATYERIVGKSFIASASLFGRRNMLKAREFANKSAGASIGIGGELPLGINAGISGSVSRAVYDAPQLVYSAEKRKDWRMFGRAYAGLRSIRFMGFSPSVEYSYAKTSSNYTLNRSNRHRVHFKLARYF